MPTPTPTMTYEGVTYPVPTRLTIGELRLAKQVGAAIPTGENDDEPDIAWLGVLLLIAKRRAGEKVETAAIDDVVLEDVTFAGVEANGDGNVDDVPPTGAAPGRKSASGRSGSRAKKAPASGSQRTATTSTSGRET